MGHLLGLHERPAYLQSRSPRAGQESIACAANVLSNCPPRRDWRVLAKFLSVVWYQLTR